MKRILQISSALLIMAAAVNADILTFDYSYVFSGTTPTNNPAPWLTATFDDGGTPGTVDLTLETTGLTGIEYLSTWYFNLDPALNVTDLSFIKQSSSGTFTDPSINLDSGTGPGHTAQKADGDGYYDIMLEFANAAANRFDAGESITYTISGISSLTVHSFEFLSDPGASPSSTYVGYYTAAHILSTNDISTTSGWTTIPEPASMVLIMFSTVGIGFIRRRLMA